MMRRTTAIVAACVLTAVYGLGVFVEPALADLDQVGRNLGKTVTTWAGALLFGVAGIVGLAAFGKHEISKLMIIALMVVVLCVIVFFPETIKDLASELTDTL